MGNCLMPPLSSLPRRRESRVFPANRLPGYIVIASVSEAISLYTAYYKTRLPRSFRSLAMTTNLVEHGNPFSGKKLLVGEDAMIASSR